jgi:short subunit dehydrogenase-like uncharacterized protein
MEYLLYGANGYTAGLVIEESLRQGMKPVLAGRNRQKTEELAQRYDLKCIVFGLNDPVELDKALKGFRVLLNCAGP